jgi:hypothetical protein
MSEDKMSEALDSLARAAKHVNETEEGQNLIDDLADVAAKFCIRFNETFDAHSDG